MSALMEVSPASDWCQRWTGGQHTWRHRSDGGFDPDGFTVEAIDEATAKGWVLAHHYSGSYPAAKLRYGLFDHGQLAGIAVLSVPTSKAVLTNVFPGLEPYVESVELGRLVLADRVASNGETWFLARVFREAAGAGVRGVVSFADPVPRRIGGRLLFPGHVGTTYKAKGALYLGRGTARTLTILPDGGVLSDRAKQKVRAQDRGHEHVERLLVQLGARPMRAGERPASWLNDTVASIGCARVRHRGNHRYAFLLGNRTERRRTHVAVPVETAPTSADREAA